MMDRQTFAAVPVNRVAAYDAPPPLLETREQWMDSMCKRFRRMFFNGAVLPALPRFRCFCGFSKRACDLCCFSCCCKDRIFEIFVHPTIADPVEVAEILLHGLVHAAVDAECRHEGAFKNAAWKVGLIGPVPVTMAGPELKKKIQADVMELGGYPRAWSDVDCSQTLTFRPAFAGENLALVAYR